MENRKERKRGFYIKYRISWKHSRAAFLLSSAFSSPSTFLLSQNKYFHFKGKTETRGNIKKPDFPGDPTHGSLSSEETTLWATSIQTPNIETLCIAVQIWSAGQGFHFTWSLFWGSKIRLYNHLEIHGSLLASEPGRGMEATKLCYNTFSSSHRNSEGKHLAVSSSTRYFKMVLQWKSFTLHIREVSQAAVKPSRALLSYMLTTWAMLSWFGFHHIWSEWTETNTKSSRCDPIPTRFPALQLSFPASVTQVWEVCFGDLWPFFLPTRLIPSFFAMYVNLGKIIA